LDARDRRIAELEQRLADALARIAQLEEQLRQASHTSSRSPSSDPWWKKKHGKKKPTGRKPGRARTERALWPAEKVSERVVCRPTACAGCGAKLAGKDPEPRRVQTFELPNVEPVVTEYELYALGCVRCGHRTSGAAPRGRDLATFGPRVQATAAVLSGVYRLGKRAVAEVLEGLFGLPISLGAVSALEAATREALAPVCGKKRRVRFGANG